MVALYILPLDSPEATLATAGGKGSNLSRLIRGSFPVPPGFVITIAAYDVFVTGNDIAPFLGSVLAGLAADDPQALEAASTSIRERFRTGHLPPELRTALQTAYDKFFPNDEPVAARSSATAEDLPDLSFAGQQDTYLNVSGAKALLQAVISCWGSLWTARAIGYRARNGIPQETVSLAVVVQAMVQAEAAGVLFTANPLNGRRTESAIDATLGLGEALVSGQVEPDHYIVDAPAKRILRKQLGTKIVTSGGELGQGSNLKALQALPDAAILDLVALGQSVEAYFGGPQDIEWTWKDGTLSLVQSRPITSLYPLVEGMDPRGDLRVLASFGAFQGVLDPLTPLGIDALRCLAASAARLLRYQATWETQSAFKVAGDRLFVDLTALLRNGFGRRLLRSLLGQVEPTIGQAVLQVWDDPHLTVSRERPSLRTMGRIAPLLLPLAGRFVITLLRPEDAQRKAEQGVEMTIAYYRQLAEGAHTLRQRLLLLEETTNALRKFLLVHMFPRFAPGMAALNQLYRVCQELPGGRELALEVTRGLPHNVTTAMDLALWDTARRLRENPEACAVFSEEESQKLAHAYLENRLPPAAQEALGAFLDRYGMRGLVEIDLGRPRWRDDPTPVIEAVQSYLPITDPALAPDAVFARGASTAQQAVERISAELRKRPYGTIKAARARWAARRVRALAGLRESPKFTIVNLLGLAREALLDSGASLVEAGLLEQKEHIFFLPLHELHALADAQGTTGDLSGWPAKLRACVDEHRASYAREQRRRQIPRVLLSDGTSFYEGISAQGAGDVASEGRLVGSPVSPGVAEGPVRVVLNPTGAQLLPGEILVCPGTDPSWTPLFLAAGGLVMEVGGLMTHGSVVAREYGIPAVVGVTRVTHRLRTGQRIRVDGTRGTVELLG